MTDTENKEQEKKSAPCSICYRKIEDTENAALLAMGHYGTPRYLCPECEELIETATRSHDVEKIESAMAKLGQTVGNVSAGDDIVLETVEEIFHTATKRAEEIKLGTYDFALDECEEESVLDEIPEELLETEEDKKKTEREAEINKKFNKVMDIVTAAVFIAALAALIYFIFIK